jgi:hypothetical protein
MIWRLKDILIPINNKYNQPHLTSFDEALSLTELRVICKTAGEQEKLIT